MDTAPHQDRGSAGGRGNIGLGLLVLGLGWSFGGLLPPGGVIARLAPFSAAGVPQPHATVVWLGLALLLLAWEAGLLGAGKSRSAWGLAALGAAVYACGCVGQRWVDAVAWLLPAGSLLAAGAVALEIGAGGQRRQLAMGGAVVVGLCLDALLSVSLLLPPAPLFAWLGSPQELPQRLLRLARVAAVVLPLMVLALEDLGKRVAVPALQTSRRAERVSRWLIRGTAAGAGGMPLLLIAAAVVDLRWKYLLPLTADLVLAGALTGAWLAWRLRDRWELLGWSLIAASMLAGMGIGGYAFDGPLPSPVGDYADRTRTLMREAHSGVIVLGMALALRRRRSGKPRSLETNPDVERVPPHVLPVKNGPAGSGVP